MMKNSLQAACFHRCASLCIAVHRCASPCIAGLKCFFAGDGQRWTAMKGQDNTGFVAIPARCAVGRGWSVKTGFLMAILIPVHPRQKNKPVMNGDEKFTPSCLLSSLCIAGLKGIFFAGDGQRWTAMKGQDNTGFVAIPAVAPRAGVGAWRRGFSWPSLSLFIPVHPRQKKISR